MDPMFNEQITNKILSHLSLEEAICTNLLSRHWRGKWRSMSDIVVNEDSFPRIGEDEDEYIEKVTNKVNHLILLHKGDIKRFEINSCIQASPRLSSWLHYLIEANVEHLKLNFTTKQKYVIPFSVFRYRKLETLDISRCKIEVPFPGSINFQALTHISFRNVKFPERFDDVNMLTRCCPLLTHFSIVDCGCIIVDIHSRNLQSVNIVGDYIGLNFQYNSMIKLATIALTENTACLYTNVFNRLLDVEELHLMGFSIEVTNDLI